MRIIYDRKQPPHRLVQFEDDKGILHPATSYQIKIVLLDGSEVTLSRWGDAKKRKIHEKAAKDAIAREMINTDGETLIAGGTH